MTASGSALRVGYVVEPSFGVTPATPTFKVLRNKGGGLSTKKSTFKSEEINPDRNLRDVVLTGKDVSGQYGFEFSYGTLDDMLEAAVQGTWTADVLKNGSTLRSFTFEEFLEMGATDSFSRFTGVMVDKFSLSITARSAVTGSIDLMGKDETLASTIVTGATYTQPNTKAIATASISVGSLAIAGLAPTPKIKSLNFSVSNNLHIRPGVSTETSEMFGVDLFEVTGTLEAYFESNALYQMVLDHGGGALSFTIGTVTGEKYTFLFPKIIFLDGEKRVGGNSDDVVVSVPFQAVYDSTEQASIKITRAVA